MDWQLGRDEHLALSEAAAQRYDEVYANSNFATGSYMDYEVKTLERWSSSAPDSSIAIDLGCGTGRDSFVLAKRFDQVFAYDFSPAMIDVANENKVNRSAGNVLFQVQDVDEGLLNIEEEFASFVNSAFGMGSFVRDLEDFFRQVKRILKPQGIAVFSFYNSQALVNQLELDWEPALAARADISESALNVTLGEETFRIAAHSYTRKDVERKLANYFDVLEISTFPTLSALFPQKLFEHQSARELCTNVDNMLASNTDIAAGPYIVAVVRRKGKRRKERSAVGYERVLQLLAAHNVSYTIKPHAPVRTMAEVMQFIDDSPDLLIKSYVVALRNDPTRSPEYPRLYLFGIPASRKLDFAKVAQYLNVSRKQVEAASQSEVEDMTGFTVGSVPPFAMPRNVVTVLDQRLVDKPMVWCGTGHLSESLHISMDDLRKLSQFSVADISKPDV